MGLSSKREDTSAPFDAYWINTYPLFGILEYSFASSAQLLMDRQLRSVIPTAGKSLQPGTVYPNQVISRRQLQMKHNKYYDRSAHSLQHLKSGDKVNVQFSEKDT